MSRKRKANHQLTKDNYEDDNKPSEEVGYGFKKASEDVLKKRKRVKVRRKLGGPNATVPQLPEVEENIPMDTSVILSEDDFKFDFQKNDSATMWVMPGKEESEKKTEDFIIPPPPKEDPNSTKNLKDENDDLMKRIQQLEQQLREGNNDLTDPETPKLEEKKEEEEKKDYGFSSDYQFNFGDAEEKKGTGDAIPLDFQLDSQKTDAKKEEIAGEKSKEEEAIVFDDSFNLPSAFGQDQNFVFDFGDTAGSFDDTPSKLHVSLTSPFSKGTQNESGTDLWAPKEGDDLSGSDLNVGSPLPPPKFDLKDVDYQHQSGEEEEETRMKCPAKLYVLSKKGDGSQYWREKGIGEVKVNVNKKGNEQPLGGRLLMHRGESLILLLNCLLFEGFPISKLSQKKLTFTCIDFGEDDSEEVMDNEKTTSSGEDEGKSFLMTFRSEKDCTSFLDEVKSLTDRKAPKKVRKDAVVEGETFQFGDK